MGYAIKLSSLDQWDKLMLHGESGKLLAHCNITIYVVHTCRKFIFVYCFKHILFRRKGLHKGGNAFSKIKNIMAEKN